MRTAYPLRGIIAGIALRANRARAAAQARTKVRLTAAVRRTLARRVLQEHGKGGHTRRLRGACSRSTAREDTQTLARRVLQEHGKGGHTSTRTKHVTAHFAPSRALLQLCPQIRVLPSPRAH